MQTTLPAEATVVNHAAERRSDSKGEDVASVEVNPESPSRE